MSLQVDNRPVRIAGNEHHHVLGLVRESFSQSFDAMGNGFKRLVIDHGHTLTVIRQQSSCPNVDADGEEALVDDAVHLSNTVSHFLVGSEKGSEGVILNDHMMYIRDSQKHHHFHILGIRPNTTIYHYIVR